MAEKRGYRSIFYKEYYQNQVGRLQGIKSSEKLVIEKKLFTAEIIPLLDNNRSSKILDIGCGFGSLIASLADAGYANTIGIDISEQQVDIAHTLGLKQIKQGDVFDFLDANKNTFDIITAMDILEHFTKDECMKLMSLIKESLTHNGMVLFRTPNADAPMGNMYLYGDFTHELILNASSAHQLMLNAGFCQVQITESRVKVAGFLKLILQQLSWFVLKAIYKWIIFATARTTKGIILTPNIIIKARL